MHFKEWCFIKKIHIPRKPIIGLYTVGLEAYWDQFEGLKERLISYGKFIETEMQHLGGDIKNYGLVDNEYKAREAGEWFNAQNVDLIFCHVATYATSSCIIPIHQICSAKLVLLNLQPTAKLDYDKTTTGEWLANCNACAVPEFTNALHRNHIKYDIISGLLGKKNDSDIFLANEKTSDCAEAIQAWKNIHEWIQAAKVLRNLKHARFGFLGNTYSGMLDMYTDLTQVHNATQAHVEVLEMCDLDKYVSDVTVNEMDEKLDEINDMFTISSDDSSDPIAKRPTKSQLLWAAKVASAQEKMVKDKNLHGLAYYYHGADGNQYEKIQSGFIAGHSLLTAKGIPCSGEGDIKTLIAMKISDLLGVGGSFCEIVTTDYDLGTILVGHDGPFHLDITKEKPVLRGMGIYHGKRGSGVSVEAKVDKGPITTLNITQDLKGRFIMIVGEGESLDAPVMKIGNTQTHVRFPMLPDAYMNHWFSKNPTHHFAISIGHNADQLEKCAKMLGWKFIDLRHDIKGDFDEEV